jgi:hypothetical protein
MPGLSKEFYEQMRAEVQAMTVDEARQALIEAGIFDENGHLADPGRPQLPAARAERGAAEPGSRRNRSGSGRWHRA